MFAENPIRDPLGDLRADIVQHLSLLVMLSSGLAIWRVINIRPFPWHGLIYFCLIFFLGWQVWVRPVYGRYLLVWGGNIALLLAILLSDNPYLPFLAVLQAFISSILLSQGELITAGSVFIEVLYLNQFQNRTYPIFELGVFLTFAVILSWMVIQTLYTALQWYSATYEQVKKLLEETRTQRASLKRTLKSLEAAYKTRQRIQQDLVEARKKAEMAQRMKERFAANISHELRTPLNLIFGFSEIMYFSPEVYGEVNWTPLLSRDIYQIYRSSRHLMEMIDDILDLSYFEQTSFTIHTEPTPFTDFMKDTVELAGNLFRNPEVRFEVSIQPDLPTIDIDRTRIRQVILNLLNNARRFTTAGFVRLEACCMDNEIAVSVIDTGAGIAPEQQTHIFNEFYQVDYSLSRKHGGAGLGLAISKRFIEAHHGHITVESEPGVGSNFTFTLPLSAGVPEMLPFRAMTPRGSVPPPDAPACLLAVGMDMRITRRLEKYMPGYQIIPLKNSRHLKEAIREHQPRAVLYNESAAVFQENIPVPCIRCSIPDPMLAIQESGITRHLSKPLSSQKLLHEIPENARSVLVIDDDPGFVQLVERFIQQAQLSVEIYRAYSGQEGLTLLETKSPDLILVDMVMPEMNGLEVIREIRKKHTMPIILLTATNYDFISESISEFSMVWSDKLYPSEIFLCMGAAIHTLKQRYFE